MAATHGPSIRAAGWLWRPVLWGWKGSGRSRVQPEKPPLVAEAADAVEAALPKDDDNPPDADPTVPEAAPGARPAGWVGQLNWR